MTTPLDWPQHTDPPDSLASRAPYNFVPLPEQIFEAPDGPFAAHDRLDPSRLHGEIGLTVRTETELYTRSAYRPELEEQPVLHCEERQDCYHQGDPARPFLPGPSVRGMVRSLVEILSYSRPTRRAGRSLATRVCDERLVARAVADLQTPVGQDYKRRFDGGAAVQGGYLHRDPAREEWYIQPAEEHFEFRFIRVEIDALAALGIQDEWDASIPKTGRPPTPREVLVQPARRNKLPYPVTPSVALPGKGGPDMVAGVLVPSGKMMKRTKHTIIYAEDPRAARVPIPEKLWEQFRDDQQLKRGLPCRQVRDGDPVFYLLGDQGELLFLGPTLFFRLPYAQYTANFIPQATIQAATEPAGPAQGLDLAEAIFGTVNEGRRSPDGQSVTGSHRGRVCFEDLACEQSNPFLEGARGYRYPGILAAPKPTSYQHYLVQEVNYDQVRNEGQLKRNLAAYSAGPPDDPVSRPRTALRGFKRYWHRGRPDATELTSQAPTQHDSQYTRIRPVRPNTTFTGRLRFENLTDLELGGLLAALELPPSCRHQLGMGKPLGLGSVQLTACVRLYDPLRRYAGFDDPGWLPEGEQGTRLATARERFRQAVVEHHNRWVRRPHCPATGSLWQIPRLAQLRALLEWDGKPDRQRTRYVRELKEFRQRKVLPSPAGVRGEPVGWQQREQAAVPELPTVPASGAQPAPTADPAQRSPSRQAPPMPRTPTSAEVRQVWGRIQRFSNSGVIVLLDGESRTRTIPLDISHCPIKERAPYQAWKALRGSELRPGRLIHAWLTQDQVREIRPAD